MDIIELLKRSETIFGLGRDLRKLFRLSKILLRKSTIKKYFASNEIKKLQLGAGPTHLDGWLNTDIAPQSDGSIFLDATKPFPFANDVFDYVYSEHMIEHITWHEGLNMLRECQRVLKPDGTMRIATLDLEVILGLYSQNGNQSGEKYIKWITDEFLTDINDYRAPFVINNAFHNWGHKFLYDAETLEMTMRETGFTKIQRCSFCESEDKNLRGIESHGQNTENEDMAAFETLVLEATKPGH